MLFSYVMKINIPGKVRLSNTFTLIQITNPLCRVVPIYNTQKNNGKTNYDKEKYRELILDAAEIVLGYFGFNRNLYSDKKNISKRKWWWLEELRQETRKRHQNRGSREA
jgi:hypothetical protein